MLWEDNYRKYRLTPREGLALKLLVEFHQTDSDTGRLKVGTGPLYQHLAGILPGDTKSIRALLSRARVKFAEAVGLPPEILNLEASKGKHRPQIFQDELDLLQENFARERDAEVSSDFTEQLLARSDLKPLTPDEKQQWIGAIEQERRNSGKRQR